MYFEDRLEKAIEQSKGRYMGELFYYIYPFATENISGYIDLFDLKDKSLLTVGSSLDQAISAALYGCRDITVLDLNPYIKEYYYLKEAAIEKLTRDEFFKFFSYHSYPSVFRANRKTFSKDIYDKLSEYLSEMDYESYLFWNKLLKLYSGITIRQNLFSQDEDQHRIQPSKIPYLKDEESYIKTKEILKDLKIKFITSNINDITLEKKFDNIFLSNLPDYQDLSKTKELYYKLLNNLNEEGKIMISYMFRTTYDSVYDPDIIEFYDLSKTLPAFPNAKLETFQGVKGLIFESEEYKDSVLTYKKIKK